MKLRNTFVLAVGALVLSACSAVYSPQPLGDQAYVLDSSWTGTWQTDDGVYSTAVVNEEQGLLQIASIEPKPGGIDIETFQGFVRSLDGLVIISIKDKETDHGYHWFVVNEGIEHYAVLWLPDPAAFKAAIIDGKLPGTVLNPDDEDSDDVVLGELTAAHFELISDPASGLIDWRKPSVLIRVAD
jgi:hypothetical protein